MRSRQEGEAKGLTPRSALVALCMVLVWMLGCCFMVAHGSMRTQHHLMVIGFGAILTVFLLQYPRIFLAAVVVIGAGTAALMLTGATPDDHPVLVRGLLRSLVVVLPLIGLAAWLMARPLGKGELATVYACVVIAIPWCISLRAVIESSAANLFESQRESEPQLYAWARELPWWGPMVKPSPGAKAAAPAPDQPGQPGQPELTEDERLTREAVRGFARGNGGHVPWGVWWRPILYWTAMCLTWQGMLMGLLLMLRKQFVEHERLPFVWSQPAISIIKGQEPNTRTRGQWTLFAIGLGICLPAVIFMSPTGEALSSWTCLPWAGIQEQEGIRGGVDLTDLNILPGTTLRLWWGPLVLVLFLLFPVDVLMTTALTYILLSILLPGLMRSFGISMGPNLLGGFVKSGLRFGGGVGLLFWSIFYSRRTLWGYLRSLWGGGPTDAASDDELPRRLVVLIFLVGLVGFIALGCYATSGIQMVLLTILIMIYCFSQIRQRIEGLPLTYDNNFGSHQLVSIQRDFLRTHYGVAIHDPDIPVTGHSWATHWMQWGFNGQLKSLGPHNMLLEAFKVGHELRVHARDIAKGIALTMAVVAAITPALFVYLMHIYGFEHNFQGQLTTWADFMQWSERSAAYGIYSTSSVFRARGATTFYETYKAIFHIFYGVAIIGVLFHLRREYPRFPFSPVGVVIAAEYWTPGKGMPFSADQVWFSFLLVWAVKSLIFRWLGVRSFREKVVPGAIMLLCGMIFGMMVYVFRHIALLQGCMK